MAFMAPEMLVKVTPKYNPVRVRARARVRAGVRVVRP